MIAYCDYIAYTIREALVEDRDWKLCHVGKIQWDLGDDGSFQSTTKLMIVEDNQGKKYKITVEEV
jgi:hypothetical protein